MEKMSCAGEIVHLEGSTLPYCRYSEDGFNCYRFDSSQSECPVPMVAALVGLRTVTKPGDRLIMINHSEPAGLLNRVAKAYKIRLTERKDGLYEIVFDYKPGHEKADLYKDVTCNG